MMTEPQVFDCSLKGEANPKRKRRFKIFENKLKQSEPQQLPSIVQQQRQQPVPQPQKKQPCSNPVEIIKIPQKQDLEKEFYGGEEEEDELQLLQVKLDQYSTVKSNRFGETNFFMICTAPSVMFKDDRLVVNEDSQLFHSIKEIKDSQSGLSHHFQDLRASVIGIARICQESQSETRDNYQRLKDLQSFLERVREETNGYERKLKEIDHRLENIEYMSGLQGKRKKSEESVKDKEELKVFIEENGLKMEIDDDDEFAESHYLPAGLINQYLQERKAQKQQEAAQRANQSNKTSKNIQLFHPIFKIGLHQYNSLVKFILEELPTRKQETLVFHLLFRRGTTDLNIESVGERSDLQYKQNLLFLIKTSTGKRIGGFINADLIEEQIMADSHAFLFTLQDNCHKFKVKEQCSEEAFTANRYYLITFSNDLMISSDCLQEENYCEWPTSYSAKNEHSNKSWFAGDFQFMIEHIQVYEILQSKEE